MKLRPGLAKGLLIGVPVSIVLYVMYSLLGYAITQLVAWVLS